MRVLYFQVWESEVVFCETPPGASILWPRSPRLVLTHRTLPAQVERWKVATRVKDSGEPRCRIVPLSQEITDSPETFQRLLQRVVKKLPKTRRERGILCVMLKGKPFEVPSEARTVRNVGFFHVRSLAAWTKMWCGDPEGIACDPPKRWPTTV